MGINDEINKTVQKKIFIRYTEIDLSTFVPCVMCKKEFSPAKPLSMFIKDEGYICDDCGKRFAPEMIARLQQDSYADTHETSTALSEVETRELRQTLDALKSVVSDLAGGISRGIIEAPVGHIGLLHLMKDIPKPSPRQGEPEKDYELRAKTHRMIRLREKILKETLGRVESIETYLRRLGLV